MSADHIATLWTAIGAGLLLVGAGWLLLSVARRAAAGTLRRNRIAGIRTPLTLSSDEAWRAAHVAGERASVLAARGTVVGGILAGLSGLLGLVGVPFEVVIAVCVSAMLCSVVWMLIWTLKGAADGTKAARLVAESPSSR